MIGCPHEAFGASDKLGQTKGLGKTFFTVLCSASMIVAFHFVFE